MQPILALENVVLMFPIIENSFFFTSSTHPFNEKNESKDVLVSSVILVDGRPW